jgi:imidazolonepropionase-like amidohydrolase
MVCVNNVFDGVSETLLKNANVLVGGNLIKAVSTKPITAEGATVIDGGGRTLMPGLIDAHFHIFKTRLWPFRNRPVADQATASRRRPEIR